MPDTSPLSDREVQLLDQVSRSRRGFILIPNNLGWRACVGDSLANDRQYVKFHVLGEKISIRLTDKGAAALAAHKDEQP